MNFNVRTKRDILRNLTYDLLSQRAYIGNETKDMIDSLIDPILTDFREKEDEKSFFDNFALLNIVLNHGYRP